MELLDHRVYSELNYDVNFWRTKSGLEVDFVLGHGDVAIKVLEAFLYKNLIAHNSFIVYR